jgi:dTDP-4-dehydrorhamnose reductase
MKVLVLGSTGMLGHKVCEVLGPKYSVIGASRKDLDIDRVAEERDYFPSFVKDVGEVDYVINAIGVLIPYATAHPTSTFFINGVFPHILAREYGRKLIHISSDCVYSGRDGKAPYNEHSDYSSTDTYGLAKSLGEPANCLTIRTSIIGPELGRQHGLLEWFLNSKGEVNGFTDHLWNGITTRQFGIVCDKIMSAKLPVTGTRHVFSNPVSKYEMLLAFRERFGVACEIKPTSGNPVDRRLSTLYYGFNSWLEIPSFQEMLYQL